MQSATQWAKDVVAMILGLCGLAGMVYGVGAKQERAKNAEANVLAAVARLREEMNQSLARLEREIRTICRYIAAATEQRAQTQRWQGRVDTTLEALGRRLEQLEGHHFQAQEVAA